MSSSEIQGGKCKSRGGQPMRGKPVIKSGLGGGVGDKSTLRPPEINPAHHYLHLHIHKNQASPTITDFIAMQNSHC